MIQDTSPSSWADYVVLMIHAAGDEIHFLVHQLSSVDVPVLDNSWDIILASSCSINLGYVSVDLLAYGCSGYTSITALKHYK